MCAYTRRREVAPIIWPAACALCARAGLTVENAPKHAERKVRLCPSFFFFLLFQLNLSEIVSPSAQVLYNLWKMAAVKRRLKGWGTRSPLLHAPRGIL